MTGTDPGPARWWLAAPDAPALLEELDRLIAARTAGDPAGTVVRGRGPARLGLVEPDDRKLRLARRLVAKGEPWQGRSDIWFTPAGLAGNAAPGAPDGGGRVAFLFPGVEPSFGAGDIHLPDLASRFGLEPPPVDDDTIAHRSASIFRIGIFLDEVLRRLGVRPEVVAGHSIGEWSGTVAAGIVPLHRADDLVVTADLDEVALPDVDFAALGAGVAEVAPVVDEIDGVDISHDNSPRQSIICGPSDRVAQAMDRLRGEGILGYTLPFQSGFHTPAVAPLVEVFHADVQDLPFGPAEVPMWSATTTAPYPSGGRDILDLHLRHLVEPVRFRELVERLYHDAGARIFVQVGLGSLTGFVGQTLDGLDHATVQVLTTKRSALAQVHRAVTALWVEGVDVSPEVLHGPAPGDAADEPAGAAAPGPTTAAGAADEPARPETAGTAAPAQARDAAPDAVREPAPRPPADPAPAPVAPSPATTPAAAAPAVGAAPTTISAAAELLSSAARASREVIDGLAARLPQVAGWSSHPGTAPVPGTAATAPGAAPTAAAAAPAPATPPGPPPAAAEPEAPATARPPWTPGPPQPWPTGPVTVARHMSLETMPETLDHRLFQQPEGWPDPTDGFPIVAMTTQIRLLEAIAAEHGGGRDVVEVAGIRNTRWLDLTDPHDVDITLTPKGDDVLSMTLGRHCRANLHLGRFPTAPRPQLPPLTSPRAPDHTAAEMFDQGLMFHGPRYHGITSLGPLGDDGMAGEFHQLDTPGSLLDNLGKLIAYWVMAQYGLGEAALPIGVERIELFGPDPPPGTDIHCDIRIVDLQRDAVTADGELVLPDGTVWGRVTRWTSIVFHRDELMEPLYYQPTRCHAAEPRPGGWTVTLERWPTGPGRELTARRYMSRDEREPFEHMNLLQQRRHLIAVVAAKDTVRRWLLDTYQVPCYPAEVQLVPESERVFRAECPHIPEHHDIRVTLSSIDWLAVALLADGPPGDIEARAIPPDRDAADVGREMAEVMADVHPGTAVGYTSPVEGLTPSRLDVVDPPSFAVAWTADPDGHVDPSPTTHVLHEV